MALIYDRTPSGGQVVKQSAAWWTFDRRVPTPAQGAPELLCPMCLSDLLVRSWRFFERGGDPTLRYRCDVSTKCVGCGYIHIFGVIVPDDVWAGIPRQYRATTIRRKQAIERGWFDA